MKKIILTLSCLCLFIFCSYSQSNTSSSYVSTAVPFLNITPDSRAAGIGDIGVATSADINSMHCNASKYAFIDKNAGVSLSYTPWLNDVSKGMSLGYFSAFYKLGNMQTISGSFRYFNLGDIDMIDANGTGLKKSSPNEFALDFAYSRKLSTTFSMGVAFRYIQSNILEGQSASSIAADVSCFYTKVLENGNIAFGANISNIGSKITYNSSDYYIPTNLKLGTTYTRNLSSEMGLSLSLDINKLLVDAGENINKGSIPGVISIGNSSNKDVLSSMISSFSDFSSITYSFGAEFSFRKMFDVRLGYFYESKDAGNRNYFTTGLGVKYNHFNFDIAYLIVTESTNPLKNTLRFTVGYIF